ncbi:MAG: O-linked N-acetylglucosamine transferase, SPINDLY family protein, partial [Isosphaeraceae bacterium]
PRRRSAAPGVVICWSSYLIVRPNLDGCSWFSTEHLRDLGQLDEAAACYREAVQRHPDHVEAINNLGNALFELDRPAEAEGYLRRALLLRPDYARAASNLGRVLCELGRAGEAVSWYRRAIGLRPDYDVAYLNLGTALGEQGMLDDAVAAYRAAVELRPDAPEYHDNLIMAMLHHPAYDDRAILDECRRWSDLHAEPLTRAPGATPHPNDRDPDRRLRIGYASSGFRDHVDGWLLAPPLAHHDHERFEIYCYAHVPRPDAVTARLRGYADAWRDTTGLSHAQVAELVRSDRIDILVDLKLHTAGNQLLVFARRPAPVQVTWLGYPGTTGMSAIDYRLTDPYVDPPGLYDDRYSERSWRLPDTIWCYEPHPDSPPVNDLPAGENGVLTFGCLNNPVKINEPSVAIWAAVLRAVPRSRFLLRTFRGPARGRVLAMFERQGIGANRLEFVDALPRLEYLRQYHRIDLALDPLPYNGHTTSFDAAWMGVPTLTIPGRMAVGRVGSSILHNLGLEDLIADSPEGLAAIAARLAADRPGLRGLRASMRDRMARSPLTDAPRFARGIEHAYREMWRGWCHPPRTIAWRPASQQAS